MSDFELEIVDDIPAPKRATVAGQERDTKLKQFVRALGATPVGTSARFAKEVRSPNYGGDGAAQRWPHIQFSTRQVGVGEDGKPLYDVFAKHIDPATRKVRNRPAQAVAQDDGLLDG